MPSKSPAQARFMRAVAHGWKKPGGGGPTMAVAKEFMAEDMKRPGKMMAAMLRGPPKPKAVKWGGKPGKLKGFR